MEWMDGTVFRIKLSAGSTYQIPTTSASIRETERKGEIPSTRMTEERTMKGFVRPCNPRDVMCRSRKKRSFSDKPV